MSNTDQTRVMVTGGAGFIGSNLCHLLVEQPGVFVGNVDALTYAGNRSSVASLEARDNYQFIRADVRDAAAVAAAYEQVQPDVVLHLAAESHVDRSIVEPGAFVTTNVNGTYTLLEQARRYLDGLTAARRERFRFINVSTDEVFGSLGEDGAFTETTPYDPSSPYSASKAAADHLVRAYHRTYGLPAIVTNCSNNYGPYQFPEKLIPLMITRALAGDALPVYGRGENVRDWLYVGDHCAALWRVAQRGAPGRTYNIGGNNEKRNLDVVHEICDVLQRLRPREESYRELVTFVTDRPGHDFRYAIDASRIRDELGWQPSETFATGLEKTIRWYLQHHDWVEAVRSGEYQGWMDTNYGARLSATAADG